MATGNGGRAQARRLVGGQQAAARRRPGGRRRAGRSHRSSARRYRSLAAPSTASRARPARCARPRRRSRRATTPASKATRSPGRRPRPCPRRSPAEGVDGDPGHVLGRRGRHALAGHGLHEHGGQMRSRHPRAQLGHRRGQRGLGHRDRRRGWRRPPRAVLIRRAASQRRLGVDELGGGEDLRAAAGRSAGTASRCRSGAPRPRPSMPRSHREQVARVPGDAEQVVVGDVVGDPLVPGAHQVDGTRWPGPPRSRDRTGGCPPSTAAGRRSRSGRWPRVRAASTSRSWASICGQGARPARPAQRPLVGQDLSRHRGRRGSR